MSHFTKKQSGDFPLLGKKSACWKCFQFLLAAGLLALSLGLGIHLCRQVDQIAARTHSVQATRVSHHKAHRPTLKGDDPRKWMSSADSSEKQWVNRMRARLLLAQTNANPVEQRDALKECIDELTPELAASLLATMDLNDMTGVAAQQLFDFWVLAEPADAAAWAQSLEGAAAMPSFMNLVALRWAVSDLKAAGSWVHTLPSGILRNDLMRTIGSEAVRSNPQEALRLAAELPEDGVQAELVCRAASEWAVTEPSSVMEWAEQIPDQMLRERVIRDIAIAHAGCDPANAVSFLQVNTSQGPEQDRAIVSIVQSWAEKDPVLASAWVKQFPDDLLGKDAVNNVIQIWASKDLHAPRDWLLTLPSGEMRNTGILAYARELRRTNEDLAEQWTSYVIHRE